MTILRYAGDAQGSMKLLSSRFTILVQSAESVRSAVELVARRAISYLDESRLFEAAQPCSQRDRLIIGMRDNDHCTRSDRRVAFRSRCTQEQFAHDCALCP